MIFDLKKNIDNFVKTTINDKNDKTILKTSETIRGKKKSSFKFYS